MHLALGGQRITPTSNPDPLSLHELIPGAEIVRFMTPGTSPTSSN